MSNKELVRAFYKEFFNDHDVDAALKYEVKKCNDF